MWKDFLLKYDFVFEIIGLVIILILGFSLLDNAGADEYLIVDSYVERDGSWVKIPIKFGTQEQINYACAFYAGGCYKDYRIHPVEEIYIVYDRLREPPAYGGCNVIWHEISHAMDRDHGWMMENLNNHDCSYELIHRNDWIVEKYGGVSK